MEVHGSGPWQYSRHRWAGRVLKWVEMSAVASSEYDELIERASRWPMVQEGANPVPELTELIPRTEGLDRAALLNARAKATQASDPGQAERDCMDAAELLLDLGHTTDAGEQTAMAAGLAELSGEWRRAIRHATAASVLLGSADPDGPSARAAGALCAYYGQIGALDPALAWGQFALGLFDDEQPPVGAVFNVGFLALQVARSAESAAVRDQRLAQAEEMADRLLGYDNIAACDVLGRTLAAEVRLEHDDVAMAAAHLERWHDFREQAAPQILPWIDSVCAAVRYASGDADEALRLLDDAIPGLERFADEHALVKALKLRAEIREAQGDVRGALADATHLAETVRRWQVERTSRLSELVAEQAELRRDGSALLERAEELARVAREDPLTGLFSRRWLEKRLLEFETQQDNGAVLLIDIDHFKAINDEYGHSAGDRALEALADVLQKSFREGDDVVRYGGEEFLIPLTCERATAIAAGERVRNAIAQIEVDGFPGLTLTVSMGIASGPLHRVHELIERADRALYKAKRAGRDQIVVEDHLV